MLSTRETLWERAVGGRDLAFETADGDALDEVALGDEEDEDDGYDHHGGSGHEEVPAGAAGEGSAEHGEAEGDCELVGVLGEVEEGAHEIVPGADEGEDGDGGEGGFGKGEHDAPVDGDFAGAVDVGGVGELGGEGAEELAQEEDVESAAAKEEGHGEGEDGVDPADAAEDDELGNHGDDAGQHDGGEQDGEPDVAAGKVDAGEAVGAKGGRDEDGDLVQQQDNDGVADIERKGPGCPGVDIVAE